MAEQMFNNHHGRRGSTQVTLTFAQVYDEIRERLECVSGDFDPDAVCQAICCELEKRMGIYPNVEGLMPGWDEEPTNG